MINFVRRIREDIKHSENLDLYVTVILAMALVILNILGYASAESIPSLTLAILAPLTSQYWEIDTD